MYRHILLPLSLLLAVALSFAERISIKADSFTAQKDKVVYEGHVVLKTDKGKKLLCDRLVLFLDENGKLKRINAIGHVVYSDGKYKATGHAAISYPDKQLLVLEGNAVVSGKMGLLKGDKIVYNIKTRDVEVKSRTRVSSVIDIDTP